MSSDVLFPGTAGLALYLLLRALWKAFEPPPEHPVPEPVAPPSALEPPPAPALAPPVVQWVGQEELIAWRIWRLGMLVSDDPSECGPRLLSATASCIWNGPAVRERKPTPSSHAPSGIYGLTLSFAQNTAWRFDEDCWVWGLIALSGCVIEHELGYRAERAVIRELHLGVGTHLAVRQPRMLADIMQVLSDHYQVYVDVGQSERDAAMRLYRPNAPQLPLVRLRDPWRLI